jgi:hypothetical protein
MVATRGWVVQTLTREKPYKVVLEHEGAADTEHPVSTMREGEALIRLETTSPLARETSRDAPSHLVMARGRRRHVADSEQGPRLIAGGALTPPAGAR